MTIPHVTPPPASSDPTPFLAGHPSLDPRNRSDAPKESDDGGRFARAADDAADDPIVIEAIEAMKPFEVTIQKEGALNALRGWHRFGELTLTQVHAVLNRYPGPRKPSTDRPSI